MCVCAIINMHPVGHLSWLFARCRRQESASSTPQVPQPVFECCFPKRRLIEIDKDMRPMGATDRTIRKHQHFCGLNSMLLFFASFAGPLQIADAIFACTLFILPPVCVPHSLTKNMFDIRKIHIFRHEFSIRICK